MHSRWTQALAAITLAGALLRLVAATPGLFGDELFTIAAVDHDSLGDVFDDLDSYEANPPGLYVLSWLVHRLWDEPEAVRLVPWIAGVALIPLVAHTARHVAGPAAGLAAAAIAAISPFLLYYGSEGRAYTPAMLCVAGATLALIKGVEEPGNRRTWIAFGACALGAAYFHYTSVFPLAVAGAWALVLHPAARRPLLIAIEGAAVLYLPWLPSMQSQPPLDVITLAGHRASDVLAFPVRTVTGYPYLPLGEVPGEALGVAIAALVLAALVAWLRGQKLGSLGSAVRSPVALLALVAVSAPLGIKAYDVVDTDLFSVRNLAVSAPALIVLVAALLTHLPHRGLAVAAPLLLVALLAYPAGRVAFGDLRRPAIDEAAEKIDAHARPQDPVLEVPSFLNTGDPLRRNLAINLDRPHRLFQSDRAGNRPWDVGLRTGRVFVVRVVELDVFLAYGGGELEAGCPDPRFRLASRPFHKGDVEVLQYVPRPGARPGSPPRVKTRCR